MVDTRNLTPPPPLREGFPVLFWKYLCRGGYMERKPKKHARRLLLTPSPEVLRLLEELHEATGKSRAGLASEMLEACAPAFVEMLQAIWAVKETPEKARELVLAMATEAHGVITQTVMDFDREPDGRTVKGKRRRAKPTK